MKKGKYEHKGPIKRIPIDPIFDKIIKLATPKWRKHRPKPGSPLRASDLLVPGIECWDKEWFKLTENSIVVGKTVALIRSIDPSSKYRFPVDKEAFEKVMKIYEL
jgi:hypothetical protein